MKKSTKEIVIAVTAVIFALAVAGWADAPSTKDKPEYTVVCGSSSNDITTMCDIVNSDGIKVDGVDMEIASENNFFSKPENVKAWVEGKFDSK
jgi:TolA-binding protein